MADRRMFRAFDARTGKVLWEYAIRLGEFPEVPEGGAVWVFALGD